MGTGRILVGPSFFLLLLFLLPGDISASATEPQYLVLVPYLIHTETPKKICIQLNHLNESVTLSITLEHGGQNKTLLTKMVTKKDVFECIAFQVPKLSGSSSSPEAFLTVEVKGDTLRFKSRKAVLVKNLDVLLFIQTDKPIYKPGETVQFRVATLDESFRPVTEKIPLIYLQDPKNNRLMQWTEVELKGGLVQLSFPLGSEPPQGTYRLKVQKATNAWEERAFEVSEYVLPKFEVVVKAPEVVTIMAEELKATVCGVYTYGMPVPGQVKIRVCRKYNDARGRGYSSYTGSCSWAELGGVCEEFSGKADANGCFSQVVKTKVFQMKRDSSQMKLEVEGKIVEEGTGVELTGNAFSTITATLSTVTFENVDTYYKPGIPLFGQAKLVDGANVPIANKTVEIRVDQSGHRANYTTDHQGTFRFAVDTTNYTDSSIRIQAIYNSDVACHEWGWLSPNHQSASHSASRFYSPSESYVHIEPIPGTLSCGHTQPVRVHYSLKPGLVEDKKIDFHYLVMAKGGVVHSGIHVQPEEHGEAKGVFSLDLPVDADIAPLARLLLYTVLPSGELVAHSADFTVEKCFRNKVELRFSEPRGLPGSQIQLVLASAKDSLCGIHAVDKSVYLLKPEAEFSPQTIYDLLPVKNLKGYQHANPHVNEMNTRPCETRKTIIVDGIRYNPDSYTYGEGDAYEILKDFGLKVFTSTKIHKPQICQVQRHDSFVPQGGYDARYGEPIALAYSVEGYSGGASLDGPEATKPVRSFFPETWLWQLVVPHGDYSGTGDFFGHSAKEGGIVPGELVMPVTIPDTITEWQVGAFCLSSDKGIGIAQATTVNAFQSFFTELTMPYSVVRGEAFTMKATGFSYQKNPMKITMSLAPSPDFEAIPVEEKAPSCLPENGRETVSWLVTPKSLGQVNFTVSAKAQPCGNANIPEQQDTVIKSVLVEPEGIEKDVVFSNLLCPAEKSQSSAPVALTLPANVVEGSARASVCALGDIMGTAIENIHQLLQLPYGCGEQNMALFVPNVYILEYLNNTGQLTKEVKSKAIGYLVAGYQKQLNYKHTDGSFSTFGEHNWEPGNTWLTAFTLVSFARAKSFIFVEEKHIIGAQASLASRQKENGCFHSTGTLLNNALKGGVDDEITMSAYITIALLEIPLPVTHSVVRNALFCLETATQAKEINTYTKALLAFAFALAGKEDKKQEMLRLLDGEAVEEDGSLHWQRPRKQDVGADLPFHRLPRAPSAEVEMTAYVLLAYLTKHPAPSQEELAKSARIVKWLVKQQNPTGGFSSTQDTVVALQALSRYGALTYSRSSKGTDLSLRSGANALGTFHVDNTNRLLLQCRSLDQVPGDYNVEATGDRCVYIQTTLKYNVHLHPEDSPFKLEVYTVPNSCAGPKAHKTFDIAVNVSYIGKLPTSNMAILDVKMLSGFIPVKSSVRQLIGKAQVKRTEVSTSHVLVYLEKVDNVTQSLSFTVEQDVPVRHLKPALVKVYDYYETGDSAIAKYSPPCSTDDIKQGNA
ncbi:alpha-2-macroglobulin isoform X2 [Zootoca vivipara]|uniref:alpha-2-macroglobulin isoform X2 n=1 Tax=Zootoca vivipara TaxID=8524 RepID=UPI00293BF21A|nr:alpha-2-macroglobulin isoform X2 [Zootoca vivipara]